MNWKEEAAMALSCGALGGLVSDVCVHPVDTIRTRIQISKDKNFTGSVAVRQLITNEGMRAFYKGFGAVAVCTIPAHALYFVGYEFGKVAFGEKYKESPFVHFWAGIWADVAGSFVWVPQDVIKQRIQAESSGVDAKYKGSWHATTVIFREEGVRGFFKGYCAALLTYAPFVGMYFLAYEQCKAFYRRMWLSGAGPDADVPFMYSLVSGAFSGAVSAALTCPMDVIKTRLQVEATTPSTTDTVRYKGIVDAIARIWKEEGLLAFWKGVVPRVLWIAPGTAITIACYDKFKHLWMTYIYKPDNTNQAK